MPFATDQDKQKATAMLVDGIKAGAVAKELGVKVDLIYGLKYELKKAGKIKGKTAPNANPKKSASKRPMKKHQDDFDTAVQQERDRLTSEVERIGKLISAYAGGNGDFLDTLEKKLAKEQERLGLLNDLLQQ